MNKLPRVVRKIPKLAPRNRDAHKGDFGRVLVVGGSVGMVGAPALAANAALRAGAGLVKIACPSVAQQAIATLAPCATSIPLDCTSEGLLAAGAVSRIASLAAEHDVIAFGPGIGQSASLRKIAGTLVRMSGRPLVIDADGLNNLAAISAWWRQRRANAVLTPHPGEMRRLLASVRLAIRLEDRARCASGLAARTGMIIVLKGAGTVVADASRSYVNKSGNPGMATGGSGDVLTGLIAGLIGQGLSPFDAAVLGVHVHGLAGDLAAKDKGQVSLIASDVVDYLPAAFLHVRRK